MGVARAVFDVPKRTRIRQPKRKWRQFNLIEQQRKWCQFDRATN
jgi:hypothetical protein